MRTEESTTGCRNDDSAPIRCDAARRCNSVNTSIAMFLVTADTRCSITTIGMGLVAIKNSVTTFGSIIRAIRFGAEDINIDKKLFV